MAYASPSLNCRPDKEILGEELYTLAYHYTWMRRHVTNSEDWKDLAQEACLRMFKTYGEELANMPKGKRRAFLFKIIRNMVIDAYHRRNRMPEEFPEHLECLLQLHPDPYGKAAAKDAFEKVRDEVTAVEMKVIYLSLVEKLTLQAIVDELDLTITVSGLCRLRLKVLTRLRTLLMEECPL